MSLRLLARKSRPWIFLDFRSRLTRARLALVFFSLLAAAASAQNERALDIKVLTKETHGLLYLLESLRGEAHHSSHLAEVFWTVRHKTEEDGRALEAFQRLMNRPEWVVLRLPGDGGRQRKLSDVLEVVSLQSQDADDFVERMDSLLTLPDRRDLAVAVRHFAPLYHTLVWEPSQAEFSRQAQEFRDTLKKASMGERMVVARHFYASTWPLDRAFWVALVPIPRKADEHFTTFGHSDAFLEVIEMPAHAPVSHQAGVAFHELCHSLWSTMPATKLGELRKNFLELGPAGRYAFDQLNEAVATALGNGWFQSQVDGKLPSPPWYHDEIIDPYARALYPLLKGNLEKGMDKAFAISAVGIFRQQFPRYAEDINVVFREILIISSLPVVHQGEFQNRLSSLGFVRSVYVTRDLDESAHSMIEQHPHTSRVYLVRPEQRRQIQELYNLPSLPERGLYILSKNDVWHVAIVATSSEEYLSQLSDLARKRYLQPTLFGPNP